MMGQNGRDDGGGIWNSFAIPHLSEACKCETAPEGRSEAAPQQQLFSPAHASQASLGETRLNRALDASDDIVD